MEKYPQEVVLGEPAEVTLGIKNYENRDVNYTVVVLLNGEKAQEMESINLTDEQEWREEIALVPIRSGEDQKVEFLLYKKDATEPYQQLHLWLDVKDEK